MINHGKIRAIIKSIGIASFSIYVVYRLKEIIVNGGKAITEAETATQRIKVVNEHGHVPEPATEETEDFFE